MTFDTGVERTYSVRSSSEDHLLLEVKELKLCIGLGFARRDRHIVVHVFGREGVQTVHSIPC